MTSLRAMVRNAARDMFYPGLDLHTRNRASLRHYWRTGARDLLDAGSGNGYFSWLAYRSGARVVALNFESAQVERARDFLIGHRHADPDRLRFETANLYDLAREERRFDEIVCYEVLEHLRRDDDVVAQFYRILRPGGVLHVCCPNARHPRHQAEVLDENETGGHVRAGYTKKHYRALLEPAGFAISEVVGIGPRGVYHADRLLRAVRNRFGDAFALPLLPLALPFVWAASFDPPMPFSLYVRALKPECPAS
jgi:2-polyprenyl-3-methyl-5-hydroxy-6-metoxy-1,4-benzoquinol methylase